MLLETSETLSLPKVLPFDLPFEVKKYAKQPLLGPFYAGLLESDSCVFHFWGAHDMQLRLVHRWLCFEFQLLAKSHHLLLVSVLPSFPSFHFLAWWVHFSNQLLAFVARACKAAAANPELFVDVVFTRSADAIPGLCTKTRGQLWIICVTISSFVSCMAHLDVMPCMLHRLVSNSYFSTYGVLNVSNFCRFRLLSFSRLPLPLPLNNGVIFVPWNWVRLATKIDKILRFLFNDWGLEHTSDFFLII